jgi:hypothetical protein
VDDGVESTEEPVERTVDGALAELDPERLQEATIARLSDQADDVVPRRTRSLRNVRTKKPRAARDEDAHAARPYGEPGPSCKPR